MTTLEPSIETWLRTFMNNPEHPPRDDVHIDQLDAALGDRATWETARVKCLVTAARLVKEQAWPVTVAMEFFLEPGRSYEPLDAVELSHLSTAWSHTPPALTAYRHGTEPWTRSESFEPAHIVSRTSRSEDQIKLASFFQQWYDDVEDAYDRRLWLVAILR